MKFSTAKNYFIFLSRGSQANPVKFNKKENTMEKSSDPTMKLLCVIFMCSPSTEFSKLVH